MRNKCIYLLSLSKMWVKQQASVALLLIILLFLNFSSAVEFKDITSDVFLDGQYFGVIAAFGDFNSDKLTDVFCVRVDGKTVDVLFGHESKPHLRSSQINCTVTSTITAVMPGDFNGDSMMDMMIAHSSEVNLHDIKILWGFYDHVDCSSDNIFRTYGLPLLVDYNFDMIPDLLGEDDKRKRCVWISNKNGTFTKIFVDVKGSDQLIKIPHSSAVLDLNNDMASDIAITGEKKIEYWLNNGDNFSLENSIDYPKAKILGQLTHVDFNSNGVLDHIMPVCNDTVCSVMMLDSRTSKWITLLEKFIFQDTLYKFRLSDRNIFEQAVSPVTLRAGDYDMDGYPDFIVILQSEVKPDHTRAVIMQNIPCADCVVGRTLKILWDVQGLSQIKNVWLAAFYDIFEDGRMDILVSSKENDKWKVHALQNTGTYDACFIKVLVLSGLCYTDCPSNHIPYGTNQPGPMIRYNTTKPNGEPLVSCGVQMSQSAHFPLQLPYSVFGLGQTPNFVDRLMVAIPVMSHSQVYKHEWMQIIPNSQMVVIPHSPDYDRGWVNKLFVTPSHSVLLTFIALVGTCGFIAIIVGILHWKERREDKIEKMQDAYRFHFDAM